MDGLGMTKIAIIGSRDYPDLKQVARYVESLPRDTVIISGGARGVDATAEATARRLGMEVEIYPAQWRVNGKFDKSAGMRRNADIVKAADKVVAFWSGGSKGTAGTIRLARDLGKGLEVIEP